MLDDLITSERIEAYSYYTENESLISFNNISTGIYLRSINPLLEAKVSIIDENIIQGEYFGPDNDGIIIGIGTANPQAKLHVKGAGFPVNIENNGSKPNKDQSQNDENIDNIKCSP